MNASIVLGQRPIMRDYVFHRIGERAAESCEELLREGVHRHASMLEERGFKQAGQDLRALLPQDTEPTTDGTMKAVRIVVNAVKSGKLSWG